MPSNKLNYDDIRRLIGNMYREFGVLEEILARAEKSKNDLEIHKSFIKVIKGDGTLYSFSNY